MSREAKKPHLTGERRRSKRGVTFLQHFDPQSQKTYEKRLMPIKKKQCHRCREMVGIKFLACPRCGFNFEIQNL